MTGAPSGNEDLVTTYAHDDDGNQTGARIARTVCLAKARDTGRGKYDLWLGSDAKWHLKHDQK